MAAMRSIPVSLALLLLGCGSDSPTGGRDAGTDGAIANQCPTPTSGPTMHPFTTLAADATWTAEGSPHVIGPGSGTFSVRAHLTLEACAVVELGGHTGIQVDNGGVLEALGTEGRFVTITQHTEGTRWDTLSIRSTGQARLTWTLIGGGGDNNGDHANVSVLGAGTHPFAPLLYVDHVGVAAAKGNGISFLQNAGFVDGSQALVVQGSGAEDTTNVYPVSISSNALGSLPDGDYTGNAADLIHIMTDSIVEDVTLHDRGVPYMVGGGGPSGDLTVGIANQPLATLTIEPGVEMHFLKEARFGISPGIGDFTSTGALIAVGTAARPIVLTAAGADHWGGVRFSTLIDPRNRMEEVIVDLAGAASGASSHSCTMSSIDDAAILIFNQPPPTLLTGCTISNSARNGITSDWRGTPVDFTAQNTFTNLVGCAQSVAKDVNGACVMPIQCP